LTAKVYGVTTDLGSLSEVSIDQSDSIKLQESLVRSHSVGVGDEFPVEVSQATMLLRANTLAKGFSGVRLEIIESLLSLLNSGITPVIPQKGSVGASGDLAPLAHMSLLLMGQGKARRNGNLLDGEKALKAANLLPVKLGPKEALALVNGTQAMAAVGALTLLEGERLVRIADIAGSLSLEALRGTEVAFDERIHRVRPILGQSEVADNIRRMVAGSLITHLTRTQGFRMHTVSGVCPRCTAQYVRYFISSAGFWKSRSTLRPTILSSFRMMGPSFLEEIFMVNR
jgi:histidine ammonia-lyase